MMWKGMSAIQKTLNEIKESQSFDRLEEFKDLKIWSQMGEDEKELFALLLTQYGSQQLSKGETKVLDNFELAAKVLSYSSSILYHHGLIFASYADNSRCLNLACQAFSKAARGDPNFFLAWYKWGETLLKLGVLDGDIDCFTEGHLKFEKASELVEGIKDADFFWKWGQCLAGLGKHSGEPHDYHRAINQFSKAFELDCKHTEFFNDYGDAMVELASLLERPEFLIESLKWFEQAVEVNPDEFNGWFNLASTLLKIAEILPAEEYFEQACMSFLKAAEIDPTNALMWLRWGQLESSLGKMKRSPKILESSLEKFAKAYELETDNAAVLSCWGEVELFFGSSQERLDLLHSAKNKILRSLELHPETPDVWYLYGACLNELGHFFEDDSYFFQAIEKFEYGLTLNSKHPLLWYGLALSHFALGELNEDALMFEKAVRYCSCVIEAGGGVLPQFWNDWGVALLKLAEITNQQAHIEAAIEKFERALKQPALAAEAEDVDLEWVYNYGCALDLLGDVTEDPRHFERAIRILAHIIQVDPSYTHARYNLALAHSHLGELTYDIESYQKAIEQFQILLENDLEDEMVHLDYGVSLINFALLVHDTNHPERAQAIYKQAESVLIQSASLGNCQAYYQLAGLYSLTDHYTLAMYYIERARSFGVLPPVEDMLHDEWLEGLRQTPTFRQFISQLSGQSNEDK